MSTKQTDMEKLALERSVRELDSNPDYGYEYNTEYKKTVESAFGRRQGQGYRSDHQWNAAMFPGSKQAMKEAKQMVHDRGQLQTNKGWTEDKELKYIGSIPVEIQYANPELWDDDDYVRKFFREFHDFSVNTD